MKNHLLEKLHPNLIGGTPLNIFKIPKNLTEKKVTRLLRSTGKKIQKNSKIDSSGAPWVWCATNIFFF